MGFRQLYYTSCEHGLSPYPGYQFNAATPGVSPQVMAEVERLTAYDPPRSLSYNADEDEIRRCPVNLCYLPSETTVVANVAFKGNDYSRRFGNYFAHALVTNRPGRDLADVVPIELWRAPFWVDTPVDHTELGELDEPPTTGKLDRGEVAAFLDEHPGRRQHLAALLDAVAKTVIEQERKVVIIEQDSDSVAQWIAAASFLLPSDLVRRMSFATYQHQPRFSPLHVVGTVPDTDVDRGEDAFERNYLFDFVAGRVSEFAVHPLAELLAAVGVQAAPGAWQRAAELADGSEAGFDDWYPVFGAASVTIWGASQPAGASRGSGVAGSAATRASEPAAVTEWLAKHAQRLGEGTVSEIGGLVLTLLASGDADERPLVALAAAARDSGAAGLAESVERASVDTMILRTRRGGARDGSAGRGRGATVPIGTSGGRAYAIRTLDRELRELPAGADPFDLLDWARRAHVDVDSHVLRDVGVTTLGAAALAQPSDDRVRQVLRAMPALRDGVVDHLAEVAHSKPNQVIDALTAGLGELLEPIPTEGEPVLEEVVAIAEVRRGRTLPTQALAVIAESRLHDRDGAQALDGGLLEALWPGGSWDHGEALIVLDVLDHSQAATRPVTEWLATAILASPGNDRAAAESYGKLCAAVREHPAFDHLSRTARDKAEGQLAVASLVDTAVRARSDRSFIEALGNLKKRSGAAGSERRATVEKKLLDHASDLPAERMARVLATFPAVRAAYLEDASLYLVPERRDAKVAARLLAMLPTLERIQGQEARRAHNDVVDTALPMLAKWRRGDLRNVQDVLHRQRRDDVADWFGVWRRDNTGSFLLRTLRKRM